MTAREVSVIAMTVTALASFGRVFEDWSFLAPALVFALGAHAICILGRHLRWPLLLTAAVLAIITAFATGWYWFSETLTAGIVPSADTLNALDATLGDAWSTFGDITAPAVVDEGFVISLAIAGVVVAFLTDWAAFRLASPSEAIAPSALLWFVPSLFSEQHQASLSIAYLAAVLAYGLIQRSLRTETNAPWLGESARTGQRSVLVLGFGSIAAVALVALVAAPAIPGGSESTAALGWRDIGDGSGNAGGTIVANNPLVDIRSQLVDLADTEVFTVATGEPKQPDYWRLTSVDKYENGAWGPDEGAYAEVGGPLVPDTTIAQTTKIRTQTVTIDALQSTWVPAAYAPNEVLETDAKMLYDETSGSLVVGEGTQPGMTYTLNSAVRVRDSGCIEQASETVPDEITDRYLELPDDFSDTVHQVALDVTADAESASDKACALMNFFLEEFEYDIEVARGHDIDRIETFLEIRLGYCEQFASAYAAMARSIGLPTRVAVGYTPGDWDEEAGVYRVRGKNAHAWPEVYLGGVGWVRFDPTPQRGAPGETDFVGVVPPAAGGGGSNPPDTQPNVTTPDSTTTEQPETSQPDRPDTVVGVAGDDGGRSNRQGILDVLSWFGLVVGISAAILALLALWVRFKRGRYLDPARTTAITASWRAATSALGLGGSHQLAMETPIEFAQRIESDGGEMSELAELITLDRYGNRIPDGAESRARKLSDSISSGALTATRPASRLRWWLDPRTVR